MMCGQDTAICEDKVEWAMRGRETRQADVQKTDTIKKRTVSCKV